MLEVKNYRIHEGQDDEDSKSHYLTDSDNGNLIAKVYANEDEGKTARELAAMPMLLDAAFKIADELDICPENCDSEIWDYFMSAIAEALGQKYCKE